MPPDPRDAAYLWDMLDAARSIGEFITGKRLDDFLADTMLQAAVERKIEIIGEAARKVSTSFKAEHEDIPWRGIIAQRNVLAHEYGEILEDRIWRVATTHVPDLIAKIDRCLPPPPGPDQQ